MSLSSKLARNPKAVFRALGHPAWVAMVRKLSGGERWVCELVEAAGWGWSTVSRYLSVLREAGVIDDDKPGVAGFFTDFRCPYVVRFIACPDRQERMPGWQREGCICS